MRRRSLLSSPPAYLGYDAPDWNSPEVFDDLTADCYIFAVASRIQGLSGQLLVHESIDGYVTRNVDNFLTDRQRRRDPVGYSVFGNLETAVAELRAKGCLRVDGVEEGRLRGESVLRLGTTDAPPADLDRLRAVVADDPAWADALPGLTETGDAGRDWFVSFLDRLRAAGLPAVRVSDLVTAVGTRARADWATRHAAPAAELAPESGDGVARLVRMVWPDDLVETSDVLDTLRRTIPQRIADEGRLRVRNGLTDVFWHWVGMIEEGGVSRPNQVELAERPGLSESTVSDYLVRIRRLAAEIVAEKSDD